MTRLRPGDHLSAEENLAAPGQAEPGGMYRWE
jgi:hypothetical protein